MHFSVLKSMTSGSPLFYQGLFSCGPETTDFFCGPECGCTSVLISKIHLKMESTI